MPRTLKVVTIPPPPATPRSDVVDIVHGERITDPYRWLEDDRSDRVKDWTDRQNARTRAALDRLPERRFLAARLRELLSVGLLSTPRPIAGRIFHTRREGEQKQAVLYVRDGGSGTRPGRLWRGPRERGHQHRRGIARRTLGPLLGVDRVGAHRRLPARPRASRARTRDGHGGRGRGRGRRA